MKILGLVLAFWTFLSVWSAASPAKIQILAFDPKALPQEIRYKGKVVAGARWLDKKGENLLLLCETGSFNSPVPTQKKTRIKNGAGPPRFFTGLRSVQNDMNIQGFLTATSYPTNGNFLVGADLRVGPWSGRTLGPPLRVNRSSM